MDFPTGRRPSASSTSPIGNQRFGRAPFFKSELPTQFTVRSEPLTVMRRRWATSHSTDSSQTPHDVCDGDDAGDDDALAMLRHWATLRAPAPPYWEQPQANPPSPGSARGPAPPALRRIAPQSTGKQYASYPSPSRFLDGNFASRLTFAQAIAMPFYPILEKAYRYRFFSLFTNPRCSNWSGQHPLCDDSQVMHCGCAEPPAISNRGRIAL